MGWGDCGVDSRGRPIGYCHEGTCDHPGCNKAIDRGLAYACGGGHGCDCFNCEGYYCEEHLYVFSYEDYTEEFEDSNLDAELETQYDELSCKTLCPKCVEMCDEVIKLAILEYYSDKFPSNEWSMAKLRLLKLEFEFKEIDGKTLTY